MTGEDAEDVVAKSDTSREVVGRGAARDDGVIVARRG